jgi:hypothetical protein
MFGFLCVLGLVGVVLGPILASIGPPGRHVVELDSVTEIENDIGPALRWVFRIPNGPDAGRTYEKVTGREMILGTALGDLVEMLYGRKLAVGDSVDPIGDCVGKRFVLVARPGKSSGGVFHSISPISQEK